MITVIHGNSFGRKMDLFIILSHTEASRSLTQIHLASRLRAALRDFEFLESLSLRMSCVELVNA